MLAEQVITTEANPIIEDDLPLHEVVLVALYPSMAVRSIDGTIQKEGSRFVLTIQDPVHLIDPDLDLESPLSSTLQFSFLVAALESTND